MAETWPNIGRGGRLIVLVGWHHKFPLFQNKRLLSSKILGATAPPRPRKEIVKTFVKISLDILFLWNSFNSEARHYARCLKLLILVKGIAFCIQLFTFRAFTLSDLYHLSLGHPCYAKRCRFYRRQRGMEPRGIHILINPIFKDLIHTL